jgi:hypothetical protein|tara:strand:+ start:166 stop:1080 length:915 start_codon:yes stop_codon:yes gene_type:complete
VRQGASKRHTLDFGAYSGFRLGQLVQHSLLSSGQSHLLPQDKVGAATPRPGAYVLWLASQAFDGWQFPRHLHLYLELKALQLNGACVFGNGAMQGQTLITVEKSVDEKYEEHAALTLTPEDGETDPYVAMGGIGSGAAAADDEDGDDDGDADPLWVPLDAIDRTENGTSNVQNEYFHSIIEEMRDGERLSYGQWKRLDTQPDDVSCGDCFEDDAFGLMDIDWWSPSAKWASKGMTTPCVVGGWAHAHAVSLGEWRQRRVKGFSGDRGLAYQRTSCSICKEKRDHLKGQLAALKTHDGHSPREHM